MCRAILNGHHELRARLGPLAAFFARKALVEDADNPDGAKAIETASKATAGSSTP